MTQARYLTSFVKRDLKKKMVFIGGPRQVGKTTFAQFLGKESYNHSFAYYNWDAREDRQPLLTETFPANKKLLIFDEVHKLRGWKSRIKGVYDKYKGRYHILVTGSARLDMYQRGGDSLLGRYHYYRLHPFSLSEMLGLHPRVKIHEALQFQEHKHMDTAFQTLFHFGGFPEVLFAEDSRELRRWQNERRERLVREDIRDVESVRDLSGVDMLTELLPTKVGSLLSLNALREDLEVNHKTITLWMNILEKFYYHFRIYPYASTKIKSLRKQPKMYLWDWSELQDEGKKLENMVASHLLKWVHFLYDIYGYKAELLYLRDIEGREVDFLVTIDKKPWFAVEVKTSGKNASHLLYFADKLKIPFLYHVSLTEQEDTFQDNVRYMNVARFLTGLV